MLLFCVVHLRFLFTAHRSDIYTHTHTHSFGLCICSEADKWHSLIWSFITFCDMAYYRIAAHATTSNTSSRPTGTSLWLDSPHICMTASVVWHPEVRTNADVCVWKIANINPSIPIHDTRPLVYVCVYAHYALKRNEKNDLYLAQSHQASQQIAAASHSIIYLLVWDIRDARSLLPSQSNPSISPEKVKTSTTQIERASQWNSIVDHV